MAYPQAKGWSEGAQRACSGHETILASPDTGLSRFRESGQTSRNRFVQEIQQSSKTLTSVAVQVTLSSVRKISG